jgi:thiosulfate sulfurtransferase
MNFSRIPWEQAHSLIEELGRDGVHIVDVRDEQSFESAHVEGALHLSGSSVAEFIATADCEKPVLVYCYHGNMSQSAAAYLAEQGFETAYSVDGGFEEYAGPSTSSR